ncbi:endonuclease domain-containing protein [Arsenicicoccus dermatophilus]|uniref:endonuclease domain-containing protein n=1 Tax=Arsenicicoccus dermatophilus TaxID=1076331 RepID=UPI003916D9C3
MPAPELNAPVVDELGEPFAYADFLWERYKLVVEYNGDHHFRTPEQRLADEARRNRLERLGYRVIVINRVDHFQHWERTMQAVERALAEQARSLGVAA